MQSKEPQSAGAPPLPTHFAPAERAHPQVLRREIAAASNNAVVDALMATIGGLLAVLNEQRQVLAVNEGLLRFMGVDRADEVLGLRVGEAVQCVHAHDMPGGCGTGEYCATCGQAIAQVTSLREDRPVETSCALTVTRDGAEVDMFLRVRSTPFQIGEWRVLLIFLQDVTDRQHRATLERAFFHDVRNTLTALQVTSDLLRRTLRTDNPAADLAHDAVRLCRRISSEIDLQRCLSESSLSSYTVTRARHALADIFRDLQSMYSRHPAAEGRTVAVSPFPADEVITTDATVLLRVLDNMIVNALEATPEGGTIRVWMEQDATTLSFCVWNPGAIPHAFTKRIFQRNFSTKPGTGRGMGTYAMKLLGEKCLGGAVTFTTSDAGGTCFRIRLPDARRAQRSE